MAGPPDLFVVCKNCRAEVSPYITECPYCGARLRKRAPKLDKGGVPKPPKQRRRPSKPALSRLRPGEMPGIRGDGRPYATIFLVLASIVLTILVKAGIVEAFDVVMIAGAEGDWWRYITTNFVYGQTGYEVAALGAIFIFGWLLERRHGFWAPLVVFALGTAAGIALTLLADPSAFIAGGSAGALALLGAWSVRDLLALRRGEEIESDLLGVAAIAVLLLLLPVASDAAQPLAGIGGALAGLLIGLPLARMPEK